MGSHTIGRRETTASDRSIGVVYKISAEDIVFIFAPGHFPDPYIDQRIARPEERYALGDFVSFLPGDGSVACQHKKADPVLRVEVDGDRVLIETQIAFYPLKQPFSNREEALAGIAAWSPDFEVVMCEGNLISQPKRDHMYTAWVERYTGQLSLMDQPISWKVSVSKGLSEPINQCHIAEAPWNRYRPRMPTYRRPNPRPPIEVLKQYTKDNFEGVVVRTMEDQAIVWSAAIPITEVLFLFGARDQMTVGDWLQFNCEVAIRVRHGCFLEGKKFKIITPILPVYQFKDTVAADLVINVPDSSAGVIRRSSGVVTVHSPILGPIEFPPGSFQDNLYGQTISIRALKISKNRCIEASWRFDKFFTITSEATAMHTVLQSASNSCVDHFSQPEPEQQMHGLQTSGRQPIADENFDTLSLHHPTTTNVPTHTKLHHGGDDELMGVIVSVIGEVVTVWTRKLGDVTWCSSKSLQMSGPFSPVAGRWLMYRGYSLESGRGMSRPIVSGIPEPIAPVLPTRLIDGQVQVRTRVTSVERSSDGTQMAFSKDVGNTTVANGLVLMNFRDRYDFRDVFLVWVAHTTGVPTWRVVEVIKKYDTREAVLTGAAIAEERSSDDDSWSYCDEISSDAIATNTSPAPTLVLHPNPTPPFRVHVNRPFDSTVQLPNRNVQPSEPYSQSSNTRILDLQQPRSDHQFYAPFPDSNRLVDRNVPRTIANRFQRLGISETKGDRCEITMQQQQHSQRMTTDNIGGYKNQEPSQANNFVTVEPIQNFQQDLQRATTVFGASRPEVQSTSQPREETPLSRVEITEDNDPLGPPVFGAVKPTPISSLLSPPLMEPKDYEGSSQEEPTMSGQGLANQPSLEDCVRRLWKIGNLRRTLAIADINLYLDLLRVVDERGWHVDDDRFDLS